MRLRGAGGTLTFSSGVSFYQRRWLTAICTPKLRVIAPISKGRAHHEFRLNRQIATARMTVAGCQRSCGPNAHAGVATAGPAIYRRQPILATGQQEHRRKRQPVLTQALIEPSFTGLRACSAGLPY